MQLPVPQSPPEKTVEDYCNNLMTEFLGQSPYGSEALYKAFEALTQLIVDGTIHREFQKNELFLLLQEISNHPQAKKLIKEIISEHIEKIIVQKPDFLNTPTCPGGEFGIEDKYKELFLSAVNTGKFQAAVILIKLLGGIPNLKKLLEKNDVYDDFLNHIILTKDFQMIKSFMTICDNSDLIELTIEADKQKQLETAEKEQSDIFEILQVLFEVQNEPDNFLKLMRLATGKEQFDIVELLLEERVESIIRYPDLYLFMSLLCRAAQFNKFKVVQLLIITIQSLRSIGSDILGKHDACTIEGYNALHWAIINNNLEMVKSLATYGFSLTAYGSSIIELRPYQILPIELAYQYNPSNFEMIKFIVDTKKLTLWGDLSRYGQVLLSAVKKNDTKSVQCLLTAGIPQDRFLKNGPLHAAVLNRNIEIVKLLIEYGGDFLIRENHEGKTPIQLAAAEKQSEILSFMLNHLEHCYSQKLYYTPDDFLAKKYLNTLMILASENCPEKYADFKLMLYKSLFKCEEISDEDIALYDFVLINYKGNKQELIGIIKCLLESDKSTSYDNKKIIFLDANFKFNDKNLLCLDSEKWSQFCHILAASGIPFSGINFPNNDLSNPEHHAKMEKLKRAIEDFNRVRETACVMTQISGPFFFKPSTTKELPEKPIPFAGTLLEQLPNDLKTVISTQSMVPRQPADDPLSKEGVEKAIKLGQNSQPRL